jgi:hypothetical protein
MDKETFLQNYIDIETKVFAKTDRNKKLDGLFKTLENYKNQLTSNEILEIIDYLIIEDITIRQPLYNNFRFFQIRQNKTR